jgi:formamidopyrimidine-DNA glycosylase
MPELPDLLYIQKYLQRNLTGRVIEDVAVHEPVVVRTAVAGDAARVLCGLSLSGTNIHGPFLRITVSDSLEIVVNLMLAGRLQHQTPMEKPLPYRCFTLGFDDASRLHLCDRKKMAKISIIRRGDYVQIPRYATQGVDILSEGFTPEHFQRLAREHCRKQVRVFINDHTILSAIGNAYADEILFDAGIHPKTFVRSLAAPSLMQLYDSIRTVIMWGARCVEEAGLPIHIKVRDHMKVRNRKGKPCVRCGTTIRREGVRGHDVFFCPHCQPPTRTLFIDWRTLER